MKIDSRPRVGVLVIARNEEDYINKTLEPIVLGTIKPVSIVVVNDGSTDSTKDKILHRFPDVIVLDYPEKHESYLNDPKLSRILNYGLDELVFLDLDYVLIMGADQVVPLNYIEKLKRHMEKDPLLAIASGVIQGEPSRLPRGSGRLYRNSFLSLIGYHFEEKYGHEDSHIYQALQLKFNVLSDDTLKTISQRPTGNNYNSLAQINKGRAFRSLGYSKLYLLFYFMLKQDKQTIQDVQKGFDDNTISCYDESLRSFVSSWQRKQLFKFDTLKKGKRV